MSNKNKRPWYRSRTNLGVIVVIVAIVVSIIVWLWPNPPPPPDFSISVNPMQGSVQPGGVIQTTITVEGIHGYEHTVSLSASGQPSGVVVTFVPPFGGPTPSYTSTVTINVHPSVSASVYTTIIKGTGTDGKEHSCKYILSVISEAKIIENQEYKYAASKDSEVFHYIDCSNVARIKPENLILFKTRKEAIASGRRLCKTCKP